MGKAEKFYLSFSRISTYIKCPQRYKYIYVDNLPTLEKGYFSFGNSIHKVLEIFYDPELNFKNVGRPPYEYLMELLESHWIDSGYGSTEEMKRAKEEARRILTLYYRESIFGFKPAYLVEKDFSINVGDFEVKGRIDRIDERNGSYAVIDYKTNSILPTLFREEEVLQPAIYTMAAYSILDVSTLDSVSLHFLRFNKRVNFSLSPLYIEKSKSRINNIGNLILHEKFEATVNGGCSGCDFNSLCPAYKDFKRRRL